MRRVTVTIPEEDAELVRGAVARGDADSVSAFVADAVHDKLARQRALGRLDALWGELPDASLEWARDRLGVETGGAPERAAP